MVHPPHLIVHEYSIRTYCLSGRRYISVQPVLNNDEYGVCCRVHVPFDEHHDMVFVVFSDHYVVWGRHHYQTSWIIGKDIVITLYGEDRSWFAFNPNRYRSVSISVPPIFTTPLEQCRINDNSTTNHGGSTDDSIHDSIHDFTIPQMDTSKLVQLFLTGLFDLIHNLIRSGVSNRYMVVQQHLSVCSCDKDDIVHRVCGAQLSLWECNSHDRQIVWSHIFSDTIHPVYVFRNERFQNGSFFSIFISLVDPSKRKRHCLDRSSSGFAIFQVDVVNCTMTLILQSNQTFSSFQVLHQSGKMKLDNRTWFHPYSIQVDNLLFCLIAKEYIMWTLKRFKNNKIVKESPRLKQPTGY